MIAAERECVRKRISVFDTTMRVFVHEVIAGVTTNVGREGSVRSVYAINHVKERERKKGEEMENADVEL